MNRRSATGKRHHDLGSLFDAAEAPTEGCPDGVFHWPEGWEGVHPAEGDWYVDEESRQVLIIVPGAGLVPFDYETPNAVGARWGYDGNADAPTLTPSLHVIGRWHGWMRAGVLVSC